MKLFCDAPDPRLPRLRCNRPLPCPYHTPAGTLKKAAQTLPERRIDRISPAAVRWWTGSRRKLRAGVIFGIRLGPRWHQVCERFLR